MAIRQIGQEALHFNTSALQPTSLDEIHGLIDWAPSECALAGHYPSAMGEKAWPPLAMFKALLLGTWYDLSDVKLAEALEDRASFRRFCGFARDEATPERTAFVRFRELLRAKGLDRVLFEAITRDLETKGACLRQGTLIDATVIGSASKGDQEAAWAKHKSRAPAHGYKAHIAADKDTGIIRAVETTPANEADVNIAPAGLRGCCARAIAGSKRARSKRITARCGGFVRASKKSSARGSAATISAACAGSASLRHGCKSILRRSLTM